MGIIKKKLELEDDKITGFFGHEINLSGKLSFQGAVRIDGKYEGEIDAEGTLIVGNDAVVTAKIKIDKAIIMGEVKGIIEARERLEIHGQGRVTGDIRAPRLIINDGAIFKGNCTMEGKKEMPSLIDDNDMVEVEREADKVAAS